MSIPSNTRRPHVGSSARIARDSDESAVNLDNVLRELIARVPDEKERAQYAELLLGDRNALEDRVTAAQDSVDAKIERAAALARAGDMDGFARIAFDLPDLNRIEPPPSAARRRPTTAQDAYEAALTSGARRDAAAEASVLFPHMNRL